MLISRSAGRRRPRRRTARKRDESWFQGAAGPSGHHGVMARCALVIFLELALRERELSPCESRRSCSELVPRGLALSGYSVRAAGERVAAWPGRSPCWHAPCCKVRKETSWGVVRRKVTCLDEFFVLFGPLNRITLVNQTRHHSRRRRGSILFRARSVASSLRFPIVSVGLRLVPGCTAEELGTFRIEARFRAKGLPQETACRLLAAGLGAIPWNTLRRP